MALYNLRLAIRHIWRRRVYSFIIVLSLAVGFACTALLLTFLLGELAVDSFHSKASRTFQVFGSDPFEKKGDTPYVLGATAQYLRDNYPETEGIAQVGTIELRSLTAKDVTVNSPELLTVDSTFLSIFGFPLYAGSATNALTSQTLVISRAKAKALFGHERPIGELITLQTPDTSRTLMVSAVLDNFPEKSHLVFDVLVSHNALRKRPFPGGGTYILMRKGASVQALVDKINKDKKVPGLMGEGSQQFKIEPLRQSYFNELNKFTYMQTRSLPFLRAAGLVCGLILFMAAFNFCSLYLLSLQERKKEAGIRKTLGVTLWRLVKSQTAEVVLYMCIAMFFALGIMTLGLPHFNSILNTSLSIQYLSRWDLVAICGVTVFAVGMVVIGFSLIQQRRVQPLSLMKNTTSKVVFSKTLFTVQFVISITLAVCAVTIIRQMHYLETAPLGFNRNIAVIVADQKQSKQLPALKTLLLQIPAIKNAAVSNGGPIFGHWMARYELEDKSTYSPRLFSGDEDFMKTLDLQLIEGTMPAANKPGRLVNEKLVKMFDIKNPIGQIIPGTKDVIIGVVKDFTATSFKDEIQPAIISYTEDNSKLLIDYSGTSFADVRPSVEEAWRKVYGAEYFSYHLIQDELMNKYKDDTFLYRTVVSYSIVSMIISCFGLFALSWAVAQNRMKEVGIRKVLGASVRDIGRLLTASFLKRIVVAFIVAAPMSYYLMNQWLQSFARKIPMDIITLASAGIAVTVVALLTMSVQSFRAAVSSPINELKND
ncbi:ABC transporter permease [Chryseolinea sp. T2]|uniref:ABC transporter permease n=1 Tax=Chryseolinea sp. T2 TaxID=3129255 RepID=UPI0030777930